MARKANAAVTAVREAREEFEATLEIESEITADLETGFTERTWAAHEALTTLDKAHARVLSLPTDQGRVSVALTTNEVAQASGIVATHILVALGLADFQVGGFEMPEHACVFCGASV